MVIPSNQTEKWSWHHLIFHEDETFQILNMRYHWLEYRTKMGHLNPYWEKGINNWADYFTKHHLSAYHKIMRYKYLQKVHTIMKKFLSNHAICFVPQATQCVKVC